MKTIRIETWANNRKLYVFKCSTDLCQNEIRVGAAPSQLKRSTGKCTSCNRKGRPFGILYNRIIENSKIKGLKYFMSYADFLGFTKMKHCEYCGMEVQWIEHFTAHYRGASGYNLDRKDPSKGYSSDNCVVCCKICNWTKNSSFTHEEFLIIGKTIRKILNARNLSLTGMDGKPETPIFTQEPAFLKNVIPNIGEET